MERTWKYKDIGKIVEEFSEELAGKGEQMAVIKEVLTTLPDLLEFLAEELCPQIVPTDKELHKCSFPFDINPLLADHYPQWLQILGKEILLPYLKSAEIFYNHLEETKIVSGNPFRYQYEVFIKQEIVRKEREELQRLERLRFLEWQRYFHRSKQRTS